MYPVNGKYVNGLDLEKLAQEYGTPLYVYDLDTIGVHHDSLFQYIDWPHLKLFYAMKANFNPDLLKFMLDKNAGIDAVSLGDILLAKKAGFPAEKIIYTPNNITDSEMMEAANEGVLMNVGSLSRLKKYAENFPGTRVCIRFNPDVVAGEHENLQTAGDKSKFGILLENISEVKKIADQYNLKIIGLHEHTGSGISEADQFLESIKNLLSVAHNFNNLEFIDFGGGFKVPYRPDEERINYRELGRKITNIFSDFCKKYGKELELYFEPGKFLTAEAGFLLTTVNTIKHNQSRTFAGVDSGFGQLIRPAMYGAYHHIVNVSNQEGEIKKYDVAGHICESGDLFARDRDINKIREGDVLAIQNAGAYCYSMAGVYNLRPMPAEVVIEKGKSRLSKPHKTFRELVENL